MKLIPLRGKRGEGKFAMVDDADYPLVSGFKWHVNNYGYVARSRIVKGVKVEPLMHRLILGAVSKQEVDHVDMNKINNQRFNIRLCSPTNNKHNRPKNVRNSTGFKGVSLYKPNGSYVAHISIKGKSVNLGYFKTAEQASSVYRSKAAELHGEFFCK